MARELWNKLEDKYMTKGIENKLFLKRKFFGLGMLKVLLC